MTFLSFRFAIFITIFFIVYYLSPLKYRNLTLLIDNFIFYGGNFFILFILLLSTFITYIGGYILERKKDKRVLGCFFFLNIVLLLYFKYTNFTIHSINKLFSYIGDSTNSISTYDIILPVGLSFYIFQTCTYLGDVYKGNIKSKHNFIKYVSFASFFPTILSGPIEKSRELLPQLEKTPEWDSENAIKGINFCNPYLSR